MDTARPVAPASIEAEATQACDVCGGPTFELHCKTICRKCGYTRDCSDP